MKIHRHKWEEIDVYWVGSIMKTISWCESCGTLKIESDHSDRMEHPELSQYKIEVTYKRPLTWKHCVL